jgi:predicted DCC family thiol-disulfide oxidoreductase YuxK
MQTTSTHRCRPLLIYDGACAFCLYWARYWKKLTGHRVTYATYQDVASQYQKIPRAAFQKAVQYIAPDGKISSAAEASFRTLSHAHGQQFWLTLYQNLPGFSIIAEYVYAFIAKHRSIFYRLSLWLWGRGYSPPRYDLVAWLFLRAMGFIYLAAFVSFGVQALGLIGSHGILPLTEFVSTLRGHLGTNRYWQFPMVFWLNQSDYTIQAISGAGTLLSLSLILNMWPRISLLLLYVLYLSVFYAGQVFMSFQWDLLLLETGFLALLFNVAPKTGLWLLRWLLFRFVFLSGCVKLLSGDPTWANLSALTYHFQTQPLPTPLAWYVHHFPQPVLMAATAATFLIELVLPFFIFCPRRMRFTAAFGILLLQTLIFLTGNYNYFNILTMVLCLTLFDDAALKSLFPQRFTQFIKKRIRRTGTHKGFSLSLATVAGVIVFVSLTQIHMVFGGYVVAPVQWLNNVVAPFRIVNTYGLFAVMTTTRPEIIIEGSDDGIHWQEYTFKYKPGDVKSPPTWNIPHQPRLDWQMWFAALGTAEDNPWFLQFLRRLLTNAPDVTALLGNNPFAPPHRPPHYVRSLLYDYRYADDDEHKQTGAWWDRRLDGFYYPNVSLQP